jgi:FkbM family methyltransferase
VEGSYYKRFASDEVKLIQELCDPSKISLDIGANQGLMTVFLSRHSVRVHCFEPIPILCEEISSRLEGRNVVVECCALSDREDSLYLHVPYLDGKPRYGWSSLSKEFRHDEVAGKAVDRVERLKVPVKRLDDYHFANVGFIKIDVEGHEMRVLRGGVDTIRRNTPNLCIEIEKRHHPGDEMAEIFAYMSSLGYRGFFLWNEERYPIEKFDVNVMQDVKSEGAVGYVSNFFFLANDPEKKLV